MISHWQMPTPGLVCSVQSGIADYNMTFEETFEKHNDFCSTFEKASQNEHDPNGTSIASLLLEHAPSNHWGSSRESQQLKYEGKINELMKGVCAASVECGAWLTCGVPHRSGGIAPLCD